MRRAIIYEEMSALRRILETLHPACFTVSTYEVAQMTELPFFLWIPRVFVYTALAAWLATFASMFRGMVAGRPWNTRRQRCIPRVAPVFANLVGQRPLPSRSRLGSIR